ncbi:unnamed protein product [Brachionus calyciflorus]|uniref:Transcription factor 25 n=1 Tax=Brachionus calyciflorus TaxID=104777 RepID=A0A813NUW4_9BILA|nr:unnamed protein product [Brachionus calyciflorus]
MTTRAIKKLHKKDDLKNLELLLKNKSDEEEESEEETFAPTNKFNFLDIPDDDNEGEEHIESNEDIEVKEEVSSKKANKKKKKKSKGKGADDSKNSSEFKFVSTNIQEDDLSLEALNNLNLKSQATKSPYDTDRIRHLFNIESKHLNADNEMIRMFGAKIVQAEKNSTQSNQRGGNKRTVNRFKNNVIVNRKATWPEFTREGLSMRLLNENDTGSNTTEFTFEHNKDYQLVQFQFLDAVESLDHNNIINVLQLNRYHIDSLIQLSDVSRIHDDTQMAADLIERALYAFQNSFHPSFKFASNLNKSFKLDYNRVENRGFYICLFKHILYIGGKACYRTSFELCKLLLSLDVENDPLGVILLIDFFAIRSSQYEYMVEFYDTFNNLKHLNLMPNMIMSYALAHFYLYSKTNNTEHLEKANMALREALTRFPMLLMVLLDKCSVSPDKEVESHKIFAKTSHLKTPEGLKYLIDLYVTRMHYEWKIPENLYWLEQTVKDIIANEKKHENFINQCKNKCKSLFSKVPPNLYRHLILSDLKEVAIHLPAEFASTDTYTFDPIPPKNSIVSYKRPERVQAQQASATRAESLLTFFQSIFPTFNPDDLQRRQEQPNNNEAEGGAAGGIDVNQIVNRLRDFFTNIEINFPATNQNENEPEIFEDNEEFD